MFLSIAILVQLLNLLWLVSSLIGLPGNWLMLLTVFGLDRWQGGTLVSTPTFAVGVGIALLGEVLEFTTSAARARGLGSSRRAAALSILGSIVGGILGAPFGLLIGALVGACAGAFLGALIGDLWAGRPQARAFEAGQAAATGRLFGMLWKFGLGVVLWIVLAVATFL